MGRIVRVAAVQMQSFPAYSSARMSYLHEPTGDSEILTPLVHIPEIRSLQGSLHVRYVDWLGRKIKSIIEFCADSEADLVVFPEYSIPPELLPFICGLSVKYHLNVVAGSHSVTRTAGSIYSQLILDQPVNTTAGFERNDVRKAVSPLVKADGSVSLTWKRFQSKWEGDMVISDEPWKPHTISVRDYSLELCVLLCIDALRMTTDLRSGLAQDRPRLLVIPSLSPTITDFNGLSRLYLLNGLPVVYVNDSAAGGTRYFSHAGKHVSAPFVQPDGSIPIAAGDEAVVVADIDLDGQFQTGGTALEHFPFKLLCTAPILYNCLDEGDQFQITAELLWSTSDWSSIDKDLPASLPNRAKENLRALRQCSSSGAVTRQEFRALGSCVAMEKDIVPLSQLKSQFVHEAWEVVGDLLQPGRLEAAEFPIVGEAYQKLSLLDRLKGHSSIANATERSPISGGDTGEQDDGRLFLNRDDEFKVIGRFFNTDAKRVLCIEGIRGIGKTAILDEIFKRVLPNKKWRRVAIEVTEGTGFPRFVSLLARRVGVSLAPDDVSSDDPVVLTQVFDKVFEAFDAMQRACLTIDDWHLVLDRTGAYHHRGFSLFVDYVLKRGTYSGNKVVMSSNYSVPLDPVRGDKVSVFAMDSKHIRSILEYHIRNQSTSSTTVSVPDELVRSLYGNPLAAVIAAGLSRTYPLSELIENVTVKKLLRERLIGFLLDKLQLSPSETSCLEYASVFNGSIELDAFEYRFGTSAIQMIESLCDTFLVEFAEQSQRYRVHPLVREHFYLRLDSQERLKLHSLVAEYYDRKLRDRPEDPECLGESISHLASAGKYPEVQSRKVRYYDELRPVARRCYASGDYQQAAAYYEILEPYYERDFEIQFKLGLCHARLQNWKHAQVHFDKALAIRPDAWWVHSAYAFSLATKSRDFAQAESELLLAEDGADRLGEPRWRYATIYVAYGIIRKRQGDWAGAAEFFKKALDCDDQSAYVRHALALYLIQQDRPDLAGYHVDIGLELNPTHKGLLRLRRELSAESVETPPSEDEESDGAGMDPEDTWNGQDD